MEETTGLLGINENYIDEMQIAVTNYKTEFDNIIADISTDVEIATAFKGSSIADTLKGYLLAVVGEIQKMSAYMDDFSSSLAQVKQNYIDKAEELSTKYDMAAEDSTVSVAVEGATISATPGVAGFTGTAGGTTGGTTTE